MGDENIRWQRKEKGERGKMPKTKKFKKLLVATKKQYGKEKGTKVAYATAKKHNWRV